MKKIGNWISDSTTKLLIHLALFVIEFIVFGVIIATFDYGNKITYLYIYLMGLVLHPLAVSGLKLLFIRKEKEVEEEK